MFAYQLCEHLGYPHPDYLLRLLSARQLLGWIDYCRRVGRFGVDRDDIQWGLLGLTVANQYGGKARIEDYMPYYTEPDEDLTAEELESKIAAMFPQASGRRKGRRAITRPGLGR